LSTTTFFSSIESTECSNFYYKFADLLYLEQCSSAFFVTVHL